MTDLHSPDCNCTIIHADVLEQVDAQLPDEDLLFQLAELLKVFGDTTRVRILWALSLHELCVCDLAALLKMTATAISHQLRILKNMQLVKPRRAGKVVYYSLADSHVTQILNQGFEHINEE